MAPKGKVRVDISLGKKLMQCSEPENAFKKIMERRGVGREGVGYKETWRKKEAVTLRECKMQQTEGRYQAKWKQAWGSYTVAQEREREREREREKQPLRYISMQDAWECFKKGLQNRYS